MSTLFAYPETTRVGRVVPEKIIYKHGSPRSAIKQLFARQVEQIVWQYKLAPETINVKATKSVQEIQVFRVFLKEDGVGTEVLRCIDQAIPSTILFELCFKGRTKAVAAYKRPSEADPSRWVVGSYFEGRWVRESTESAENQDPPLSSVPKRVPLPLVTDLGQLYEKLLDTLMPYPARQGEDLQRRVERMERIRLKRRELERCEARLRKEKQFNFKVVINAELRDLKQELEGLVS